MKLIEAIIMAHQEFGKNMRWSIRHGHDGPMLEKKRHDYLCYDPPDPSVSPHPNCFVVDSRLEAALARLAEKYPFEVTRGVQWQIELEDRRKKQLDFSRLEADLSRGDEYAAH